MKKRGFIKPSSTTGVNETSNGLFPSLAREGLRVGLFPARGKAAFTLAEVLITLAIIGVVAALTLPTLIAKVNEKVDGNQKKVTEAKLIQGLNMLDLHGGINNTYSSTAEFAEELSKYMKITKICDGTNTAFSECIPYSEITYNNGTEDKTVEITKLNTADALGLGTVTDQEEFMAPVAMVLADGTPMFLTYNKNCISDPDSIKSDNKKIHSCVDGLYDLNGSRMPNRVGKDLTAMNKASINIAEGPAVLATIAGYDIIKQADYATAKDCNTYKNDFPGIITHCPFSGEKDRWVGALVTCKEMRGHLPTMDELHNIAKVLYHDQNLGTQVYPTENQLDTEELAKLGLYDSSSNSYNFYIWSSEEMLDDPSRHTSKMWVWGQTSVDNSYNEATNDRSVGGAKFICLANN
ncbi:type II secretion system protein [bacterium]|nr:type II secretion system protein [bacterium]